MSFGAASMPMAFPANFIARYIREVSPIKIILPAVN
jgi:hypothetical protein